MPDAPDWIKWEAGKWLVGTALLDRLTEYVYFRLCQAAYEKGSAILTEKTAALAMMCKSSKEEVAGAVAVLIDFGKLEMTVQGGLRILSVERRLAEASAFMETKRQGAAKARMRKELLKNGVIGVEADALIQAEFADAAPDLKTDIRADHALTDTTDRQTDTLSLALDDWNEFAKANGLSQATKLTKTRKAAMAARLKENGGREGWKAALARIGKSEFLLGKSGRGDWRANLDWLLQASSFQKLIEGAYDGKGGKGKAGVFVSRSPKEMPIERASGKRLNIDEFRAKHNGMDPAQYARSLIAQGPKTAAKGNDNE